MDMNRFYHAEFIEHAQTMINTHKLLENDFLEMTDRCVEAIENGNKIMFFGNGGSAADSQHLATELAVRYKNDRKSIASMALTTDTSALTAIGNDFGFDFYSPAK